MSLDTPSLDRSNLKWGRSDCCYTDWWREDSGVCITVNHEAWIGSCDFSFCDAYV